MNLCLLPFSELSIESDFKIEKEEQQEWSVQSYEIQQTHFLLKTIFGFVHFYCDTLLWVPKITLIAN